jgi:hypothetical protein
MIFGFPEGFCAATGAGAPPKATQIAKTETPAFLMAAPSFMARLSSR